jgi:hypothetical protein
MFVESSMDNELEIANIHIKRMQVYNIAQRIKIAILTAVLKPIQTILSF